MNNWDPPRVGGTPEIPVTPTEEPRRWWKRKYGRLPVWAWAAGGVVGLSALSAAIAPDENGQLASVEIFPTTSATEPSPSRTDSSTTVPTPATAVTTVVDPTTTVARATVSPATAAPQVTIVVTLPATTTTAATTTSTTAPPPPPTTVAILPLIPQSDCHPNYTGCVPIDSDVDCAGGSGNGPSYVRGPVTVIGSDIYGLDSDGDGIGCE